ncbi:MAG: transcriptional regulator [Thermoprotei archaeon]|nr:MAG: transcriptional regulator [Thermoprotei archaeon]
MRISPARIWRERGARYRLEAVRCRKCGHVYYPPKKVCPACRSREMEKVVLPPKGKLLAWSIEYTVPEGYRKYAPIVLGLVELQGGVRVLAPIVDVRPEELRKGMMVEAVLRRVYEDGDEGVIVYGIKFVPAEQD